MLEHRIPSSSGLFAPALKYHNPGSSRFLRLDIALGIDDPGRQDIVVVVSGKGQFLAHIRDILYSFTRSLAADIR